MATKREECYKQIYSDQQQCLEQAELTYEEYTRQRKDRMAEKADKQ